ncbi:MAG: DUF4287 domain-containing protein [Bacteroidales bacterium]|nr:DUF4287 domain-containing protein [Bacteroidales bacterium]
MKTANEMEKEFLDGLEDNYGQNLKSWMEVIRKNNFEKLGQIQTWLKKDYNFRHTDAYMLAAIYLNNGKPVYGNENDLLDNQIGKYEIMRPLFDFVSEKILKTVPGSEREIKKTYVSFKKKREFAAVNVKKDEIRLGMDLGDRPFDDKVKKANLTGPMASISHMVVISDNNRFDKNVEELLKTANGRVNEYKIA